MAGVNQVAASVGVAPVRGRGAVPVTAGISLVVGSGLLTWWAVGNRDSGDGDLLRSLASIDVPSWVEPTVGLTGCALLVLASALMTTPTTRRGPRLATASVGLLTVGAVFSGAAWRVITAGTDGMNLGGALLAFLGPAFLALLAMGAVTVEARRRDLTWRATATGLVLVALAATGLEALFLHLA